MKRTRSAMTSRLSLTLALSLAAFAAACGGSSDNLPPPPPPPSVPPPPPAAADAAAPEAVTPAPAPAPAPAAELPAVTLTIGSASPNPAPPAPTVKIMAPAKGQLIPADKASDFVIKLDVKSWKTATGDAHVHLILDNRPYKPMFDTKAEFKLKDLTGGEALAEGHHVLVAFPSRANHESVKGAGAIAVTEFFVGKKVKPETDITKAMLVYSRPKGEYKGEMANHVLVDYRLLNTEVADGKNHVRISVMGPGIESTLTADSTKPGLPYYLDNLRDGSYTVKLDLLGPKNEALPGAWNTTTRTIVINHAAPVDAPPAAAAPAATPAPAPAPAK